MIGPPVFMFMAPSKKIRCVSIWHLNLKKRLHVKHSRLILSGYEIWILIVISVPS